MMGMDNNTLYRRSQVAALEKISDITARAWRGHLPEIIWHIGWTGASGQCESLEVLRLYASKLGGVEVVEHKSHWSAQFGSGVHLRYDGDE